MNSTMRWLAKISIVVVLIYVAGLASAYSLQRRFMYLPPINVPKLEETNMIGFSEVPIKTVLGDEIIAWWHAPEEGEPIVMYFHGNGSAIAQDRMIYQDLQARGFGVLAVEYPGYPGATGKPTQDGLVASAVSHYDFLIEFGAAPADINLYGTSLGAAVAAQLASQRPVAKIVVEAPFNSMVEMSRMRAPMFAHPSLVHDQYLSYKALEGLDIPLLWLHGTSDIVIPKSQGQKLFDSYDGPKEYMIITGGRHSNLWVSGGQDRIVEFISR